MLNMMPSSRRALLFNHHAGVCSVPIAVPVGDRNRRKSLKMAEGRNGRKFASYRYFFGSHFSG